MLIIDSISKEIWTPEGFKRRSCVTLARSQIRVMRNGDLNRGVGRGGAGGGQHDPSPNGYISIATSMFTVMFAIAGGPHIETYEWFPTK